MKFYPTVFLKLFPVLLISIFSFHSAQAQFTESALKGRVTDKAGNVVVASPVVARNDQTGQIRTSTTDDNGAYLLAGLSPGNYTIFVRVAGFKTFEQRALKLSVGQTTELNIKLEVGDVTESVSINAGTAQTVSTEARLADNFAGSQINSLPLPQRDVFLLPKLSAGATAIAGSANSTKLTNSPVVTVNGNRYRGNNYVLDGAINTNPNNTGEPTLVPALESLEEAQVQTSNFSTVYGRGIGAVINL